MGTRHLIAAVVDGEYKIAQYGQWNGYPSGQGKDLLGFLLSLDTIEKRDLFRERVRQTRLLKGKEVLAVWSGLGICDANGNFKDGFEERFPWVSRNCGAGILKNVYESEEPLPLQSSLSFAGESLFCEWAYVLDLDTQKLEVYKGFNQKVLPRKAKQRFSTVKAVRDYDGKLKYRQVRLFMKFDLNRLPTPEKFVELCEAKEARICPEDSTEENYAEWDSGYEPEYDSVVIPFFSPAVPPVKVKQVRTVSQEDIDEILARDIPDVVK